MNDRQYLVTTVERRERVYRVEAASREEAAEIGRRLINLTDGKRGPSWSIADSRPRGGHVRQVRWDRDA